MDAANLVEVSRLVQDVMDLLESGGDYTFFDGTRGSDGKRS